MNKLGGPGWQSVKRPTLGYSSGHHLTVVVGSGLTSGSVLSAESASDSFSLPLCPSLPALSPERNE